MNARGLAHTCVGSLLHAALRAASSKAVLLQVYDFSLPLLLLHATTYCTAVNMRAWLRICPRRQITVLDTHDGMGIDDIEGLAQAGLSVG